MCNYSSNKYIFMICISICIAFLYIIDKQQETYSHWFNVEQDKPRIVYINENRTDDNHYEGYQLTTGILQEEIHEYDNNNDTENGNDEEGKEMKWLNNMHKRFALRKARLIEQCQILNDSLNYSMKYTLKNSIYMTTDYNLLTCVVAKAGVSTWKSHLTWLNTGNMKITKANMVASLLLPASVLIDRMFNNKFIRVMNVRHPLQRLVSAYRNKFKDGIKETTGNFMDLVHKYLPERRGSTGVTFSEFLKIIVGEKKAGVGANIHWMNLYKACSPCALPYDYIMQIETHDEDLRYIFKMAGIPATSVRDTGLRRNPTSQNESQSDTESKYWVYYEDVNDNLLREIYHIYNPDIQLFGYEIPQFLQRVIKSEM